MNDLKYTSLFYKYNDDCDTSKIIKACVYLPNEGIVLNSKGEVFRVNNTGFIKLEIFSKKKVLDFAYATTIINFKVAIIILVLTEYAIYGWGPNQYRQVSIYNDEYVPEPRQLVMPTTGPFKSISCVYGHCMALISGNCLILWGSNSHGQIGNGTLSSVSAPYCIEFKKPPLFGKTEFKDKRIIDNPNKIVSIACSARNSYVLLENGDVYGWGENLTGQLGTVHYNTHANPSLIYSRIKQFVAFGNYALALREDGTLFGNGDNSYGQLGDHIGKQCYFVPFRFDMKFKKVATWKNLSMGLTEDGKCFIWGDYGVVEFASIRLRIPKNTDLNLNEEKSKKAKSKSADKSKPVKSKQKEIKDNDDVSVSDSAISELSDLSVDSQETTKVDENNHEENESNDEKEDKENAETNLEEKRKIQEIINSGKIEKHRMELNLKRPTEIKCKSFSKIIAKRCNEIYFTAKSDMSNGYRSEVDDDLIDFTNFIVVIYEYEETVEQKVEPVVKTDDQKEKEKDNNEISELKEKYKKLEEKFVASQEQQKPIIQKIHIGDKSRYAVFDKSNIEKVDDFKISDILQAGSVSAPASNC